MTSLRTRPTGYVLQAAPETVDAAQFERILLEVRAEMTAPNRTRTCLAEALSLWRGPAFSDFSDAPWARLEAARLESLRLDALGDLFDARLTLGQHRALVPELDMLAGTHTFYERFWANSCWRSIAVDDRQTPYGLVLVCVPVSASSSASTPAPS